LLIDLFFFLSGIYLLIYKIIKKKNITFQKKMKMKIIKIVMNIIHHLMEMRKRKRKKNVQQKWGGTTKSQERPPAEI